MAALHLVKLSVGTETVDGLEQWQQLRRLDYRDGCSRHVTRMWPKREAELLKGGSMYWVIKGSIQARQEIAGFEEVICGDGIRRCAIVLKPDLIRTQPALRRPFQGWRYLKAEDAPMDLPKGRESEEPLPTELATALAEIGVL
ncbi:MAG: DUF1489 domain-containing protein [Pseudomonadota bacterium]|nr:DUF1489 domain-containing protein [Pseudomonadota bacterium]